MNIVIIIKGQLNEIQKVSLARVICDNNDGTITTIQPNTFKAPTGYYTA
jgi:peroxidase